MNIILINQKFLPEKSDIPKGFRNLLKKVSFWIFGWMKYVFVSWFTRNVKKKCENLGYIVCCCN